MYQHETQHRVLYGETDQMGYLYYGHYPLLYEQGRVELLRSLGTTYKDCEAIHRVMLPVVEVNCRYKRPALYDEMLTIHTKVQVLPSKMITFHHTIISEEGALINNGYVKLFFVDMNTNKRVSCPTFIYDQLLPYFA